MAHQLNSLNGRSYELPYIASTVVVPLLKEEMEKWNVLDEPRRFREEFNTWKDLLQMTSQIPANVTKRPEAGTQVCNICKPLSYKERSISWLVHSYLKCCLNSWCWFLSPNAEYVPQCLMLCFTFKLTLMWILRQGLVAKRVCSESYLYQSKQWSNSEKCLPSKIMKSTIAYQLVSCSLKNLYFGLFRKWIRSTACSGRLSCHEFGVLSSRGTADIQSHSSRFLTLGMTSLQLGWWPTFTII